MSNKMPASHLSRHIRPRPGILALSLLFLATSCATPKPRLVTTQPQPAAAPVPAALILAIRSETASRDPTGSLHQIMSILGRPAAPIPGASEIIVRLPGNVIKANVQLATASLAIGGQAMIGFLPTTVIQPY